MSNEEQKPSMDATMRKRDKWYNSYIFPLIPIFEPQKANEYNTSGFSFHWLFIRIWSKDSFDFELAFVIDPHWGIGFTGLLPYLRLVFCIPCPPKFQYWIQRKLWRKPKKEHNLNYD